MKYENFEEVSKICKELDRLTELRDRLTGYPIISISNNQGTHIMKIGCGETFEHEYSDLAQKFISRVIDRVDYYINELNATLSKL